ncbi:hypothetical protein D9615_004394 [Tricholomella constricta]|uniref:Uncharacterized protein n=1 Tax=Tricholomella constricta TaxID=117010 RepID=A0A8H5HF76_9AGAR|nr:hypothetical protein D9615_004394 [Tricholomella constricta]
MTSTISARNAFRCVSGTARRTATFRSTRRCLSTMHGNDPDTLESEKNRNLSKQQHKTSTPHANAPGWNEALASESEADVKADRSGFATTSELQEQTVEYIASRYSPDDRTTPTTAHYSRDEVSGPLGSAAGHHDPQEVYQTVVKKVTKKTTQVVEDEAPTQGYS